MAKQYSLAEVAEHKTRNDCWVVLFGKVYNVTNFLDEHPGGDDILLKATGRDATADFDDVGHSHEAWALLEKLYVGDVHTSTIATSNSVSLQPQAVDSKKKRKKYIMYALQFLVPLILLNVVVAFFNRPSA